MTEGHAPQRVVVLLDSRTVRRADLEAAARLAAHRRAGLHGLFIEDTDLVRSAAMPFAGEIGLTSARLRPMSQDALERQLRDAAEFTRTELERLAHQLSLQWSFNVSRGRMDEAALGAIEPDDLLVMLRGNRSERQRRGFSDREARIAFAAHCTVMILDERPPRHGRPVMALLAGVDADLRTLAAAAELARDADQPLILMVPPMTEEAREALHARIREWSLPRGIVYKLLALESVTAPSLVRALHHQRGRVLVVHRDSEPMQSVEGRHLLDRIEAPVIVVP